MAWFWLILGGLFEVGFTTALRFVDGFRNILWTIAFILSSWTRVRFGFRRSDSAARIASRKRVSGRLSALVSTSRLYSIAPLAKFIHAASSCWS